MTLYDVAQQSAAFVTKVTQQHSIDSSLRPGAAMTPSTTIPFASKQLHTAAAVDSFSATWSYCEESYGSSSSPPLIIDPTPKKTVEDVIPGFVIAEFRPMPFRAA
jgi:hypothetical protein